MTDYYIDSHAHLACDAIYEHIDEILKNAQDAGVAKIVNICTDIKTLVRGVILSEKYPWIYNSASTTPHDVDREGAEVFPIVENHAKNGALVAIGETGLDYYYSHSKPETQKIYLRKYLQLALETKLPVIIHCRDAFKDFFQILDEEYIVNGKHSPGVLHCFTGTVEEAEAVIERGWYLSLSGIVTFKKSTDLQEVAKKVPLDQLLIETDSPYLAPQSHRGKQNQPAFVVETAQFIADLKQIPLEILVTQTRMNAEKLFNLC